MTDYNSFTTEELLPGAAGTSFHFQRWANNPIAMFEGAPGAPRLERGALRSGAFGNVVFFDMPSSEAGGAWTEAARFNFVQETGLRITFAHGPTSGGAVVTAGVNLYRAGTVYYLASWSTTVFAARSLDVWVMHGDLIQLVHRLEPTYIGTSLLNSIQFKNDGTKIWDTMGGRVKF